MKPIPQLLQELDRLYYSDFLEEYEKNLQTAEQQVQQSLPGLRQY